MARTQRETICQHMRRAFRCLARRSMILCCQFGVSPSRAQGIVLRAERHASMDPGPSLGLRVD
jgi:hypothetical protein